MTQTLKAEVLKIIARSAVYDERLKDEKLAHSVADQLRVFVDGLVEYTEDRLQRKPPGDNGAPHPFNLLSDKVLDINTFLV